MCGAQPGGCDHGDRQAMKKKKLIRLLKVENKVLRQEVIKLRLMLYLTQDDELPLRKWSDDATTTTADATKFVE